MTPEDLPQSERVRLPRRQFLMASAAAGVTAAGAVNFGAIARARTLPKATTGTFAYGVASGFPSPTQITLWTRVAGLGRSSKLDRRGGDGQALQARGRDYSS